MEYFFYLNLIIKVETLATASNKTLSFKKKKGFRRKLSAGG